MNVTLDTGGSAFPRPLSVTHGGVSDHQHYSPDQDGMTLRDYFAAQVMVGEISLNGIAVDDDHKDMDARTYYKMADAMLRARNT